MSWWQKLKIDSFLMIMILVVILATLLPAQGEIKVIFQHLTTARSPYCFFCMGQSFLEKRYCQDLVIGAYI